MRSKRFGRLAMWIGAAAMSSAALQGQVWQLGNQVRAQPGGAEGFSDFGWSLAVGDFDDDGYDDLAVGAPFAENNLLISTGRIDIYRGGPDGLSAAAWYSHLGPSAHGSLGYALAAADFDGDGRDELAVGSPDYDEDVNGTVFDNSGRAYLFQYEGSSWSLIGAFSQAGSVPGVVEESDRFGLVLVTGRFDDDAYDDLAVAAPCESVGALFCAGAVNVFYGSVAGLIVTGGQIWHRTNGGVAGTAEAGESFGAALAAGDFDGDDIDDLAVGGPWRDLVGDADTGAVVILAGSDAGLTDVGQQELGLADLGFAASGGESFGYGLAAGNFNQATLCIFGCADDLAIGAPGESVFYDGSVRTNAGRVYVVAGSSAENGLDAGAVAAFDQSILDPAGTSAPWWDDSFGEVLVAGGLDRAFGAELVVGAPHDKGTAGVAHLLFGGSLTMDDRPLQFLESSPGLLSAPAESGDNFANALAIGDFDGDGYNDLAIGLPGRDFPGEPTSGIVQILYGALFADGFERGTAAGWSAAN